MIPVDAARGSAWIADQLRQAIVEGTYKFGQKLPITTVLWHSDITGVTVLQARIRYTRSRTGAS